MAKRKQLRREAAHLHGRIDRRARLIHRYRDRRAHQAWALARHPAALPIAFACGVLVERMNVPGKTLLAGYRLGCKAKNISQHLFVALGH